MEHYSRTRISLACHSVGLMIHNFINAAFRHPLCDVLSWHWIFSSPLKIDFRILSFSVTCNILLKPFESCWNLPVAMFGTRQSPIISCCKTSASIRCLLDTGEAETSVAFLLHSSGGRGISAPAHIAHQLYRQLHNILTAFCLSLGRSIAELKAKGSVSPRSVSAFHVLFQKKRC